VIGEVDLTAAGGETISVVCPVFNEEEGIYEFYDRTRTALQSAFPTIDYELIFVDDGSSDGSASVLRKIADTDSHVSIIEFSRNFGHQLAITAGIDHAEGDAVVVIDSDLQDPPEVIDKMINKWREGFHVVYGQRTHRPGEGKFKLMSARAFYRLINWMSDVELPLDAGDFRLMDRRVVNALKDIREENRYMRGLVAWVGYKQVALPYQRDERYAGETKYPLRKMLRFASDGITSFSERPLRIAIQLGSVVTTFAFLMACYIVGRKVVAPHSQLPGYASLMVVVLLLGGIQLLTIGILGQYLGRTYRETKRRPLYIVAERINVDAIEEGVRR
jgi:polyisoprenyl-phosphate glycosyltransferase